MPFLANEEWNALLLSTLAGLSTVLGALIAIIKRPDNALLAFLLGMAFGVMVLLSIVELWIHNAVEHGFLGVSASLAGGAALYLAIHPWIPDFQGHSSSTQQAEATQRNEAGAANSGDTAYGELETVVAAAMAEMVQSLNEPRPMSAASGAKLRASGASKPSRRGLHRPEPPGPGMSKPQEGHELQRDSPSALANRSTGDGLVGDANAQREPGALSEARAAELMRLGLLMAITMTLHNAPEGFAVAFASFTDFGGVMALAIAVHNIPEGVIVAAPVFAATGNRWAALGIALASGLSEPVGALVALLLVKPFLNENVVHYLLAFVGGIMLAVSASELWPEGRKCKQHARHWQGILFGAAVMGSTLAIGA